MAESETNKLPGLEATMLTWAREAGDIARRHYRRTGDLRFKKGRQAVTDADLEIEKMLRRHIGAEFPADGIVGEELGSDFEGTGSVGSSGRTWHLDPVDGTLNFALGLPGFCTSMALLEGDEVLAACIHQPTTGDSFTAVRGRGTRLNGLPLRVSARQPLAEAVISTQFKKGGRFVADPELLHDITMAPLKCRRTGAIALELAWVASGGYDALIGSFAGGIHLWDVAAGLLLVREAGGTVTDHRGEPYRAGGADLVVSNGLVHQEILDLIAAHVRD